MTRVTLKEVYDLLIDVQSALNYCGDSYERECTETERDELSNMRNGLSSGS